MPGTKTIINKLTLLSITAVSCFAADYFPLQTGNSWVYRATPGVGTIVATVNVGSVVTISGRDYYQLQSFDRNLLIRQADNGSLLQYSTDTKTESVWLPFGLADIEPAQSGSTSTGDCSGTVSSVKSNTSLSTPLGDFSNVLAIRYTPTCADAGVTAQYFLPFVGLIRQEQTSFAGPVVYDLIYSRTGVTNIDVQTIGFTTALDSPSYKSGQEAFGVARLTLRASEPVKLTFPSGQSFDLRITNEKGESVYQWAIAKLFIQIVREEQAGPGDRTWAIEFPVGQFPPGKYKAEAWLTTQPEQYRASVGFEVR